MSNFMPSAELETEYNKLLTQTNDAYRRAFPFTMLRSMKQFSIEQAEKIELLSLAYYKLAQCIRKHAAKGK